MIEYNVKYNYLINVLPIHFALGVLVYDVVEIVCEDNTRSPSPALLSEDLVDFVGDWDVYP